MDFWNSRVQWALGLVQKHYQSEPKFDSKAFWQWRCATLELAAMDQNCRQTGAMPLHAMQSVNFSVVDKDQYMDALYADITHTKNWDVAASSMRRMHPALASLLKLVTLNTYNPEKKGDAPKRLFWLPCRGVRGHAELPTRAFCPSCKGYGRNIMPPS